MDTNLHPANKLAVARTILANERTLLAYFRSALGAFIGGAGLIKFFEHPVYMAGGALLFVAAVSWLAIGIRKYLTTKRLIGNIDPEDWEILEGMLGQDRMP